MIRVVFFSLIVNVFSCFSSFGMESSPECKNYFLKGITAVDAPVDSTESLICPLTKTLITWARHLKNVAVAPFDERVRFFKENKIFPGRERLQKLCEDALNEMSLIQSVKDLFEDVKPLTAKGAIVYASILLSQNLIEQVKDVVKQAWQSLEFTPQEQSTFMAKYKDYLDESDHKKRVDLFFSQKKYAKIELMMPVLPQKLKTLVMARLAVAQKKPSMTEKLNFIAQDYKQDPGLLYERIAYLNYQENYDESFNLVKNLKPKNDFDAEPFLRQRHLLAREAIKRREHQKALDIALDHGIELSPSTRKAYALACEFSGWIWMHYFKEPAKALNLFSKAFENYETKFSQAKAAFYASLCEAQMNNVGSQTIWLEKASESPGSFYGQLALAQLQKPIPDFMPVAGSSVNVQNNILISYACLLSFFEQFDYAELFFKKALENLETQEDYIHFANLITRNLPVHNRVHLFKLMMRKRHILFKEAYPIPYNLEKLDSKNLSAFLGLMLQESNFNEKAISPAGAIGLAQVMSKTAKETAKKNNISYVPSKMMTAEYNAKIGNYHFNELFEFFTSSLILTTSAYNAGKDKTMEWLGTYGDPRTPSVDKLSFIAHIPYHETRGYVEFVLGNYGIYKRILEETASSKKAVKKR